MKAHLITSMIIFLIIGCIGLIYLFPILGLVTSCIISFAVTYYMIYQFIKNDFDI
jgi:hypothetical protein